MRIGRLNRTALHRKKSPWENRISLIYFKNKFRLKNLKIKINLLIEMEMIGLEIIRLQVIGLKMMVLEMIGSQFFK